MDTKSPANVKAFLPFLLVLLLIYCGIANADENASTVNSDRPKVMVFIYSLEIDTTFLGVAAPGNRNVENQIENRLIQAGFEVIDAGQFDRRKELETLLAKNDYLSANRLLLDFGADILIYGDVRRSFVGERLILGRPTRFFSNELRIKAVSARTARVLFSGYETKPASGEGTTLPLEEATSALCAKLIPAIEMTDDEASSPSGRYELHISEITFDRVPAFIQSLDRIEGIEDAEMQAFNSGQAVIGLTYDGSLMDLAEKLTRMDAISLRITRAQSNKISAHVNK